MDEKIRRKEKGVNVSVSLFVSFLFQKIVYN